MSKKKQNEDENGVKQPDYVEELLKNGTATLEADTREALGEMLDQLPVESKYGAGAVGRNPLTGKFTLRIDLIKE